MVQLHRVMQTVLVIDIWMQSPCAMHAQKPPDKAANAIFHDNMPQFLRVLVIVLRFGRN